ncbi:hypothetical protein BKA80DRAFT_21328 [Phyllosticta citrichinensis]
MRTLRRQRVVGRPWNPLLGAMECCGRLRRGGGGARHNEPTLAVATVVCRESLCLRAVRRGWIMHEFDVGVSGGFLRLTVKNEREATVVGIRCGLVCCDCGSGLALRWPLQSTVMTDASFLGGVSSSVGAGSDWRLAHPASGEHPGPGDGARNHRPRRDAIQRRKGARDGHEAVSTMGIALPLDARWQS